MDLGEMPENAIVIDLHDTRDGAMVRLPVPADVWDASGDEVIVPQVIGMFYEALKQMRAERAATTI